MVLLLLAYSVGLLPFSAIDAAQLSHVAIPLGFLVAIFGYRFLDIDPLLSAAASYSILAIGVYPVSRIRTPDPPKLRDTIQGL
jgi:hypothetical protein